MSGRLIISTKKSYCPWTKSNDEKYRKAEGKVKETQRREEEKVEQVAAQSRWNELRHKQHQQNPSSGSEHVHLFPPPVLPDNEKDASDSRGSMKQKSQRREEVPFYLSTQTLFSTRPNLAATTSEHDSVHDSVNDKERSRKHKLDPMQFLERPLDQDAMKSNEKKGCSQKRSRGHDSDSDASSLDRHSSRSRREQKQQKRERKEARKMARKKHRQEKELGGHRSKDQQECQKSRTTSKKDKSSSSTSIEELRKRRLEREQEEQRRQSQILFGGTQRNHAYNNQYQKYI